MIPTSQTLQRPLLCALLLPLLLLTPGLSLARQSPTTAETPPAVTTPPAADAPLDSPKAPSAQPQRPADAPTPGTAPRATVRLLDTPPADEQAKRIASDMRLLGELGIGLATTAVGALVGAYGGISVFSMSNSLVGPIVFVALGAISGASVGVYGAGQLLGGDAEFTGPFVGALIGGGLGLLGLFADGGLAGLVAIPCALLGAIIGYESTEHGGTVRKVQPLLSYSSRGPVVGLAGTF